MGIPTGGDKKNIVKLAYLYFQEGRWDNAIEEYLKLLELDPEDINIHNMLGDVYVRKNAFAQAYDEYAKVAADLINRGQIDKATLIHKKIARLDGSQLSPEARQKQNLIQLHTKAEESLEENKVEEAIEAFSLILKLDPDDLIVASRLAELEEKIGHIPDAVQQYMLLGDSFMKSHLFKKAQETFKKVVTIDPQNTAAHLNLAQIYTKQGSESDAKKEYLNIAEHALAKNDLDNALEYANKAVELKSIEAHYIAGVVLYKQSKWPEAKNEFDNLLRFKVNHVGALVYLGRVFAAMAQPDKAADSFQKALKVDKDNFMALEAWAEYCVKKKNVNEAIQALDLLIDQTLAGNDDARAIEFARTLVSVDETLTTSKVKLAKTLQSTGDSKGAADIYYDLALIDENQNKMDEAQRFIKKALELNPSHDKALGKLVESNQDHDSEVVTEISSEIDEEQVMNRSVKTKESEQSSAQVVDVSPQEALKAQIAIADQYVKEGLLDEAIDIYQQLLDVDPDNAEVKKKINTVYTAYAKTGTDLTGVFAVAPKVGLEAKKVVPEEPVKKSLKELEIKAREDADKQVRVQLERRAREEADKKANEEIKRLAAEKEKKAQAQPPVEPVKLDKKLPAIGGLDDMVALAEANLLRSQGRNEEAAKIYRSIMATHPENEEVRKKLEAIEELLKSKAPQSEVLKVPPILKVVEKTPVPPPAASPAKGHENDSNIKKKSNKIGYV